MTRLPTPAREGGRGGARPKAVLLGRVSTSDRGQDTENQLVPLRDVARRQGWEVVREIRLELSAWDEGEAREVWDAIVRAIVEEHADVLAVWALDRLCRGTVPQAFAKLEYLERHLGIQFYSLQEPFLGTGSDPEQRELMLSIRSWAARWESERRSQRLRAAASARRNRAEAGGGRATWGSGKMPTRSDVTRILRLRAKGRTLRAIAEEVDLSLGLVHKVVHPSTGEPAEGREGRRPPRTREDVNGGGR